MRWGRIAIILIVGLCFAKSVLGAPANWAVWVPTHGEYTHSAGGSFGDFGGGPYDTTGIDHWSWYYCWYGHLCTDQPAFDHYRILGDYYDCEGNLLEKDALYWAQTWTVVGGTGTIFDGGIGGGPGARACFAQETKTPATDCRVYVDMTPVIRPGWSCEEWPSFPESSQSPGKNLGRQDSCELYVKNPINVATGNNFEEAIDLTVLTPGIALEFIRSYNSQSTYSGPLGYGWTHNYNIWLGEIQTVPEKRVVIWDGDGQALYFTEIRREPGSPGEIPFSGESGVKDRLTQIGATGEYLLNRKKGNLTYRFDPNGILLEITDPNQNRLTLTYNQGQLIGVSNNFGKTLAFQYDATGFLQSVTDPKGQAVSYIYQGGDLILVTFPDGNSMSYDYLNHNMMDKYDSDLKLIGHWEYDGKDKVTGYHEDDKGWGRVDLHYEFLRTEVVHSTGVTSYSLGIIDGIFVVKEIDGCSSCGAKKKRFEYSQRLDLVSVTYIDGQNQIKTRYVYDDPKIPWEQVGEVIEKAEAVTYGAERTAYYAYSHLPENPLLVTRKVETHPSVANPGGNKVITHTYDDKGNLLTKEERGYAVTVSTPVQKTLTTQYGYNGFGQAIWVDGPRTDVVDRTTLEYYPNSPGEGEDRGQLKAIINPLGQRTEFSNYDANGNVGTINDPNSVVTAFAYDERNRLKTVTNQSNGAITEYLYDSHGNVATVVFPEGNRIDYTWDPADRLTDIRDSLGNTIHYVYDSEGNRIREKITDPGGVIQKHLNLQYDPYHQIRRIVNPDGTYTEYGYNGYGNRISTKDPNGHTTNYAYDELSRLIQVTKPGSIVTGYRYDSHDNLTSVTDGNGNRTDYIYDDFKRLTQTVSPDTGATTYLYDEAGNLIEKSDAMGTVVTYTYDSLNRLTAVRFPDSFQDITYTYDSASVSNGLGRLTGMTDPSGTSTLYYDSDGNLIKEEKQIGTVTYTLEYAYDKNRRLRSVAYPSRRIVTYELDGAQRISHVRATLNGQTVTLASDISYLPFGGIKGLSYGNGLTLVQGYDQRYQVSSIGISSIMDLAYTQDPNGNITQIQNLSDPTRTQTFGYDEIDRLVSATGIYGQISHTYDPVGNRLDRTADGKTDTYAYGGGTNRLLQVVGDATTVFTYDSNGNTLSENGRAYTYDLNNRLISISDNGTRLADYVYNGSGQRVKKTTPGETRVFHYDLYGHLIAETDEDGTTLVEYVFLGDAPLAMIGEAEPGGGSDPPGDSGSGGCFIEEASEGSFSWLVLDAEAADAIEAAYYFHNDHLGTPQAITNQVGQLVWQADYQPFGEASIVVEGVESNFRFPGQYFDSETGLHYNYFRD